MQLRKAHVLAVGAGGIGCELLKTLVLSGFENIEVIDMDTIETSNLNRQFLFRKRHVGDSKALVAAKAVQQFRPAASIKAHQANIKEQQYGVDFFKSFDIVLNGLDNLEARRHVNRLCLASGTPLVESGTAGYQGQVSVHLRIRNEEDELVAASECFECQPKAVPKSYPICTIRNTPDKPIHCVVWAKDLLFQRLFGSPEEVTDLDEKAAEAEEDEAGKPEDLSEFQLREGEASEIFARRIFHRVFCSDIEKVSSMEDLWKIRAKPMPLRLDGILREDSAPFQAVANGTSATHPPSATRALGLTDHHKNWSLQENTKVFLKAVSLFLDARRSEVGSAVFDKDDNLAVELVTAASNLRALSYGIPTQSLFNAKGVPLMISEGAALVPRLFGKVKEKCSLLARDYLIPTYVAIPQRKGPTWQSLKGKGMAGNIIHAIASTNATIAGLIVVEAMKILAKTPQACKMTYLQQIPSGKRLVTPMLLSELKPNPTCVVCGTAQLKLSINTDATLFSAFVDKVLKKRLAMNEPTVMCGGFGYEEGADLDPDEVSANEKFLPMMLSQLPGGGIIQGSIVSISDQAQDFSCQIIVSHKEDWDEEKEPEGFTLSGAVPEKEKPAANGAGTSPAEEESDDDFEVVEAGSASKNSKRKRSDDAELGLGDRPAKFATPGGSIALE